MIDQTDISSSPEPASNNRQKILILAGVAAVLLILAGGYLAWASARVDNDIEARNERAQEANERFEAQQEEALDASEQAAEANEFQDETVGISIEPGEVLVINRVPGDDYGRLAIRRADGSRDLLDRTCMRVHIAGDHGVCLSDNGGVIPGFTTTFFESSDMADDIKSYSSALPSRARLSPDGSISSVTAFVSGTSYADISTETTTIVTIDEIDSTRRLRGASGMRVDSDNDRYANPSAQFWGMTFADNDEFYITGFFQDEPEILHGSLDEMTLEPTGWTGSCPSLSPDGSTLIIKKMLGDEQFELIAVDLATDEQWTLNAQRDADDQVEWLDDDTILYAVHPPGGDTTVQPQFDIWMLDIAPGSEPELFLPNADSPAVFR